MLISELVHQIEHYEIRNFKEDFEIKSIAYHSKKATLNSIYVAIKGFITDGHKYIEDALNNGAKAAIVEEFVDVNIMQIKVKDSRRALSLISDIFYNSPTKKMKVIGITATNGKTTTSFLVETILRNTDIKTGLIGSVMNKIGDKIEIAELTTPESLDLQEKFYNMQKHNIDTCVMEVSSSALELNRVADVDYDIVSFANLAREHIDQHGSFKNYWMAKSSLIKNAKEEAVAILNIDYEMISSLKYNTRADVITFSINGNKADVLCRNIELVGGRAKFRVIIDEDIKFKNVNIGKDEFDVELNIPGYHSIENAMASICIALAFGVDREIIINTLKEFKGVERRFEFIYEGDYIIIDDHFANLKNINSTLESISDMDKNKFHIVYAIRGNRGPTVNRENAKALISWKDKLGIEKVIATRSVGDVTQKDEVKPIEEEVFKEEILNAGIPLEIYDTIYDAIKKAIDEVQKGDIILLAGCQGMDMGAKIALDIISNKEIGIDKEKLFDPIKRRITEIDQTM
jgi:UDP-N-acetylmuramoyl-L-alanyl-D-glutamate--2,6-diaminopimelate ligase